MGLQLSHNQRQREDRQNHRVAAPSNTTPSSLTSSRTEEGPRLEQTNATIVNHSQNSVSSGSEPLSSTFSSKRRCRVDEIKFKISIHYDLSLMAEVLWHGLWLEILRFRRNYRDSLPQKTLEALWNVLNKGRLSSRKFREVLNYTLKFVHGSSQPNIYLNLVLSRIIALSTTGVTQRNTTSSCGQRSREVGISNFDDDESGYDATFEFNSSTQSSLTRHHMNDQKCSRQKPKRTSSCPHCHRTLIYPKWARFIQCCYCNVVVCNKSSRNAQLYSLTPDSVKFTSRTGGTLSNLFDYDDA